MRRPVVVDRTLEVDVPAETLWTFVTDWPRHGDWIPLTRVRTVGGSAHGVGGRIVTRTGVGPVGFSDPLTVTAWDQRGDEGGRCALVHTGRLVKGDAEIVVSPVAPGRSRVRWVERLELGGAGRLAWRVLSRLADRGVDRVLRQMASLVEAEYADRQAG